MKTILSACIAVLSTTSFYAQSNVVATGGDAAGSGGSSSFSVGQIDYGFAASDAGFSSLEGIQQPLQFSMLDTPYIPGIDRFIAYPNPAAGEFTLRTAQKEGSWTYDIIDISGRSLKKDIPLNELTTTISIQGAAIGVYILSLKKDGQTVQQIKIIKK